MRKTIRVRIFKGESQYVGEGIDLPVVTQGSTPAKAAENLREAIALYLEGEGTAVSGPARAHQAAIRVQVNKSNADLAAGRTVPRRSSSPS